MAKKTPVKPTLPKTTNPDGVKSVYVNNMEFIMNGMEARLLFNEVIMETGNALAVERRATVVMRLQHFVAMAHLLQNQAPKAV